MPYYPSSQVKTNLYTNGSELTLNGANYAGYYFINSKGEYYSGQTPQDSPIRKLEKLTSDNQEDPVYLASLDDKPASDSISSFYNIDYPYYAATGRDYNSVDKAPLKPIQEVCVPTEDDYNIGEFQRYFLKKNNETQYIEVKAKQQQLYSDRSSKVQWQLYTPITITWVLEGKLEDVYNINKNIVKLSETRNKCYGFVSYFNKRFTKFHKEETPSAKVDMEGFHIMPDGTRMKDSDMPNYNASTKISGY
tara:strand:+ start:1490 stop:2236 length:747 start_codon:yes stop_codon:yes gene_type:complete